MGQAASRRKKDDKDNSDSPTKQGRPHIYAIILSAAALVISSLSLWESHESRQISYQSSMAFLEFEIQLREPLESRKLDYIVKVRNSGKSVARELVVVPFAEQIVKAGGEMQPIFNPKLNEKMMQVLDLQPGAMRRITPHPETQDLTGEEVSDVIAGRETLYIYGMVIYKDLLNNTHTAHFCRYYHPTASGDEPNLSLCSFYNDTH